MKNRTILLAIFGVILPLAGPALSQTPTPTPPPVQLVQSIDPLTTTVSGTVTITDVACNIASVSPGPSTVTDVTDDPTAWGMFYAGPSQFTVIPSNSSAPPVTVTLVSGRGPGTAPAFSLSDVPQGCTTFSFPVSFTGGDIATQCRMVNHGILNAFFISVPSYNVTLTSASCSVTPTFTTPVSLTFTNTPTVPVTVTVTDTPTAPVTQTITNTPTFPVTITVTNTPTAPVSQTATDTPTAPVSTSPTNTPTAPVSATSPTATPPPVQLAQFIDPLTTTVSGTVTITDVACNIASVSPGPSTVTDVTDDPTAWGMFYAGPSQFTVIPSNSSAPPVTVTLVSGRGPGTAPAFSLSDVPQGCTTFSFPVSFTGGDIATQCRMVNHGVLNAFFISVPSNNVTLTSASCSVTPTFTAAVSLTFTNTPTTPVTQTITNTPTAPVSTSPTNTPTAPVSATSPTNTPTPVPALLAMQLVDPSAPATVDFGASGSVVIPAGAVSAPTTITITGGPVPSTPPVPGFQVQGIYYNFTANGQEGAVFAVPVAMTFPYNPGLIPPAQTPFDLRVLYFDPTTSAWVSLVPTAVNTAANTLTVVVNHFSWWAVGSPLSIPSRTATPTPSPTHALTVTATSTATATPSPSNPGPTLTPTFSFGHGCEDDPCDLRCQAFKAWDRDNHAREHGHPMRVFLSWHAAEHGTFKRPDGYLVYRAAQDKGPYQLIQTLGQTQRDREGRVQTTDDPGPGHWCYTVKAFEGRFTSQATSPCCTWVAGEAPTPTPTPRKGGKGLWHSDFVDGDNTPASSGPEAGLLGKLSVGPNPSRDSQPIRFTLQLGSPARITLSLFTIGGERVYTAGLDGQTGSNELVWTGLNFSGTAVASGLYCYILSAEGAGSQQTRTGKVAILH